jgi:hypothetical protein
MAKLNIFKHFYMHNLNCCLDFILRDLLLSSYNFLVRASYVHPGCPHLSVSEWNLANSTVEPKTGIEFPVVLDNLLDGEQNYSFNSG